ncbi:MAG: ATP-binding cassette domain-containing protein, partial [Candidatus Bathyarchaeia archaeon]
MGFAVQVNGLVKVYDGKVKALDGVDLRVDPGRAFALLGPNGAGKTTLIRILTTQLKPTFGEAYVFGLNVVHDSGKVRRLISYVPQEMSVWTYITGYENLLIYAKIFGLPGRERAKIISEALENMGLSQVKDNLVETYSGGMIRRLEIACAMLIKPKIMFLDEPTIGLDPAARKAVWERLSIFKKEYGVTIFFNTHYMDEADLYADDIAIMNQGKIMVQGTGGELKHSLGGEII